MNFWFIRFNALSIFSIFTVIWNAILAHKSQNPNKFVKAIELQNSFRAGQCNYEIGSYMEAYKFEKRFPFSEIGMLIPYNVNPKPYYKNNLKSLI